MNHPTIDLSACAREYGLSYVPEIVFTEGVGHVASYSPDSLSHGCIEIDRDFYTDLTDSYDEARFASVGVGPLSNADAHRFVLAHELWHARQDELQPRRRNWFARLVHLGLIDHDASPIESEADQAAAKAYRLVKFRPQSSAWSDRAVTLPSPIAADRLASTLDESQMGETDCPHACAVEPDGVCPHGYESAALTLGMI